MPYSKKDSPYAPPINNDAVKWINSQEFSHILVDAYSEGMSINFTGLKLMVQYCVLDKKVKNFLLSRKKNKYENTFSTDTGLFQKYANKCQ